MFTESQFNNPNELPRSAFQSIDWRHELQALEHDFHAVIDEANLEMVRSQISTVINTRSPISENAEAIDYEANDQMIRDFNQVLSNQELKKYIN